jgi:hypothetical protein
VEPEEAPELRAFVELVEGAEPTGALAWALKRFEMGIERPYDVEALSDYLLALQGLLDGAEGAGRASLSLRLAALCAEEQHRREVQRRVELAFSLERYVIAGGSAESFLADMGGDTPRGLTLELEDHLRAVLRDVICGYLEPDLKGAADDILLRGNTGELEIKASDMREESEVPSAQCSGDEPEALPSQPPLPRYEARLDEPDVWPPEPEPEPVDEPEPVAVAEASDDPEHWAPSTEHSDSGVTPSADWDEDPDSYSAPV